MSPPTRNCGAIYGATAPIVSGRGREMFSGEINEAARDRRGAQYGCCAAVTGVMQLMVSMLQLVWMLQLMAMVLVQLMAMVLMKVLALRGDATYGTWLVQLV
eukprot:200974-Rhodomonas_salina.1